MKRCLNCMKTYRDEFEVCPHCGYVEGTPPKEIYFLKPGSILRNRFIIGTSVGAGGFGITYRAWDQELDKMVAIKEFFPIQYAHRAPGKTSINVLKNHSEDFEKDLGRFLEEARIMAKFSGHPNIVNVHGFFKENNTAYINMEFLEGQTFKDYIKQQGGKLTVESAVSVTVALLGALKAIHKEKIIHRDISPDNVFICTGGSVQMKLIDFGAARLSKEDPAKYTVLLKPGYAPPEQYQTRSIQGAFTDIYAVGAMLYRCVTGKRPCESTDRLEKDELQAPMELNPEVDETLNNAIMRAMAIQPELRFQTDDEFINALQPSAKGKVRGVEEELKRRRKKRGFRIAAATLLLVAAGGVSFWAINEQRKETALAPTQIEVWMSVPDETIPGAWTDEQYQEMFKSALEEFNGEYNSEKTVIDISLVTIPESEYLQRLTEAKNNHTMPQLYSDPKVEELRGQDLSKVFSKLNMSEYSGLRDYKQIYPENNVLPVTCAVPVVYISKIVEGYEDADAAKEYRDNMADGKFDVDPDAIQAFLNDESAYLLADTSSYWTVQEKQAGKYELVSVPQIDASELIGFYAMAFCLSEDANTEQTNAGLQILRYLLGQTAQNNICIVSHLDLPLQDDMYKRYLDLNREFVFLDEVREHLKYME